ncbi:MAG: aminodeoxychorismate synthase component I [Puniceicoccales bacterium]
MPIMEWKGSGGTEQWFGCFSQRRHCVWLDGVDGGRGADWSILAADPVETRSGPEGNLLEWMDEWDRRLANFDPGEVPFVGGLIGQLDYEPEVPGYPPESLPRYSGWLGLYDRALVEHRPSGRLYAVVGDWVERGESVLQEWIDSLQGDAGPVPGRRPVRSSRPQSNQTREQYIEGVRRIREWIASGDIYQANLSQRFRCEFDGSAADLYRCLRKENPSPYSSFLDIGAKQILSSSPELFLEVTAGREVVTRPIKGTRPRSSEPEEDRALAAALRKNEKEQSELLMIVDMERNDLGRVSEVGSVKANREFMLESFAAVHHLVGEVRGKLRADAAISDLFAATFPGGSITGAPKSRAMEIIRELEPDPRGAYCGTIGFLSAGGVSRWSIAIRTMEVVGAQVEFGVGAGIVWDSDPESEFEETLHKARKMFASLGWAIEEGEMQ